MFQANTCGILKGCFNIYLQCKHGNTIDKRIFDSYFCKQYNMRPNGMYEGDPFCVTWLSQEHHPRRLSFLIETFIYHAI